MHRFHPDLPSSPSLGYGGMDYLGPTIEAHVDQLVTVRYANDISAYPLAADVDPGLHGVSDLDRTQSPPRFTCTEELLHHSSTDIRS